MEEELLRQIEEAGREGWLLCVGCTGCAENVPTCNIETRKFMGLPPKAAVEACESGKEARESRLRGEALADRITREESDRRHFASKEYDEGAL